MVLAAAIAFSGDSPAPVHSADAKPPPDILISPSSIYSGHATYRDGTPDFRLVTSSTGRRLIVRPGYFKLAQHCNEKWRGTVDSSELPNRHWVTVVNGRFSGAGTANFRPSSTDPTTYVANWTVAGAFTSSTRARGTVRVSMHWKQHGKTVLTCPPETARWVTNTVTPISGPGSGRG